VSSDLLIYVLAHKIGVTPDFAAGKRYLDDLTVEALRVVLNEGWVGHLLDDYLGSHGIEELSDPDEGKWQAALGDIREELQKQLGDLEDLITKPHRDMASMVFEGWWLYVTGGASWGDPPTEAAETISALSQDMEPLGGKVLEACGFDWPENPSTEGENNE
jgi:hypothetical protein